MDVGPGFPRNPRTELNDMSWTEQQIQALRKMWGNGFSASDIAKSLGSGMTRNAVIGKAHRLKLSAGPASASAAMPSKVGGSVVATMAKVDKSRVMLRPLPPVQRPGTVAVKPVVKEALRPIESKRTEGIAVTKAGERQCRWPIGDPRSPEFRFCGCSSYEGLPYCVDHARVAYQTVSRKSRVSENSPEFRMPSPQRF